MGFLLDTNACVDYFTGRYPKVVARIQESPPEDLFLSSIVVAELRYGADHSARRRTNHARIDAFIEEVEVLGFDVGAASAYGRVRAFDRELLERWRMVRAIDRLAEAPEGEERALRRMIAKSPLVGVGGG